MKYAIFLLIAFGLAVVIYFGWKTKGNYDTLRREVNEITYTVEVADSKVIEKLISIPIKGEPSKSDGLKEVLLEMGYQGNLAGLRDIIEYKIPEWSYVNIEDNSMNAIRAIFRGTFASSANDNKYYIIKTDDGVIDKIFFFYKKSACEYTYKNGEILTTYRNVLQ